MMYHILQNKLHEINVDKAVQFVLSCMNFDGGFGSRPGSESHSGQVSLIVFLQNYTLIDMRLNSLRAVH